LVAPAISVGLVIPSRLTGTMLLTLGHPLHVHRRISSGPEETTGESRLSAV
jgi:hypothetical protein